MNRFQKTRAFVPAFLLAATIAGTAMSAQAAQPSGINGENRRIAHTVPGAIAARQRIAAMKGSAATNANKTLAYGGGTGGVGVLSGPAKVYLVYYGTQWGTATVGTDGYTRFSNDPSGAGLAAQKMYKGIGTNGELWQAELTQWCDGAVATNATSCPAGSTHIPYQTNVLAGVWYDNAAASPSKASALQLANEADKAAAHFGNTTAASNRYTYYVILSPTGTNPNDYKNPRTGYCAWHDHVASYTTNLPHGDMAFSNQPYNTDVSFCGKNFLNAGSAGTLDGYTMTLGHEWHEMMSDQFPKNGAGGWTNHDSTSSWFGYENSDECAWISGSSPGGAANVTFSTGTFAQQASWSNDTNSCAISHPVVP